MKKEKDNRSYCDMCNGEDLASVCEWCHRLGVERAIIHSILTAEQGERTRILKALKLCPTCNGTHGEWIRKAEIVKIVKDTK